MYSLCLRHLTCHALIKNAEDCRDVYEFCTEFSIVGLVPVYTAYFDVIRTKHLASILTKAIILRGCDKSHQEGLDSQSLLLLSHSLTTLFEAKEDNKDVVVFTTLWMIDNGF
uniref:AlNc14C68G4773 protein n=1 Tax=Albugo laibachii Nc14 TaxID=890382 RepID=F0WDQ2_9STRA|nr:AlNc14C68G4773 [Albugo laibachii Nc14]|eukprot:CCA19329.1 AlNc14C68G4773 [Albugo laibachii Nc14]